MSTTSLIVFIDGLGFDIAEAHRLFPSVTMRAPIRPGLGFSVNVHMELFAGQQPDEAGFFCEWTYAPHDSPYAWLRLPLTVASALLEPIPALNVLAHRALTRLGCGVLRIPFRELPWLARRGRHVTVDGNAPLLRSGRLVSWADVQAPYGERDSEVFERALSAIRDGGDGPVIVTFVDLDAAGHRYGPFAPRYAAAMETLNNRVEALVAALDECSAGSPVVVVSDHGQSPVERTVELDLEAVLGKTRPGRYAAFVDSTLVRVWSDDDALLLVARDYLADCTRLISSEERTRFGVTNRAFGDLIAVAPDCSVLVPSHFGGWDVPKGMHGYHPDERSQWAFWGTRGMPEPTAEPLMPSDAHVIMSHGASA